MALTDRTQKSPEPSPAGWTSVQDVCACDGSEHVPATDARRWPITSPVPVTAAAFAAAHGLVERYTVTASSKPP
ncbi:hypothetical protein [Streptomyces sp. cg40]|uniref:hypothetical protein n=1 Tax=Streptomyces sp. cg40 TaxID=3419764 RepID=UPI003D0077B9